MAGLVFFALIVLCTTIVSAQRGVAFSGVKTTGQFPGSRDNDVTFDRVDANLGGGFDGTTFTVPVAGLYLFMFSGFAGEMTIHLKVNGQIRRSAEYDASDIYLENIVSNSALLSLAVDDQVGIFLSPEGSGLLDGSEEGLYTSFSGALLYESTSSDVAAFSATKTTDQTSDDFDVPIMYDVIDINIGNHFDNRTFVAPHSGLYLFTFATRSNNLLTELKINGNSRRSIVFYYFTENTAYSDNAFSNYLTIILNKGDRVGTYLDGFTVNADLNTDTDGIFTEFSGVLLSNLTSSLDILDNNAGQQIEENVIAFSATRNVDMIPENALSDVPILYGVVDCNIGQGYDGMSKFTAPVSGYYLFTFSYKSRDAKIHLKVNGLTRRSAMRYMGYGEGHWLYAANSAILRLNQNDEVQVFLTPEYAGTLETSSEGVGYTHFSGVLLYEI